MLFAGAAAAAVSARRGVRPLLAVIGLAVTVGCMYLAVRGVELDDAVHALRDSDLLWLLPTVPVFALGDRAARVRWWSLFEPRSARRCARSATRC